MKLQLFIYDCAKCGNEFKVPQLPVEPYGEFLLRSESGEVAYLYAMESKEFNEIGDLIEDNPRLKKYDRRACAKFLHEIYGYICDLAPDGTRYQIGASPLCPHCKSNKMASWIHAYPPEFVEEDIKEITHFHWNSLTNEEKIETINNALNNLSIK